MHGLNLWFLAGSGFFITWDLDWNCDGFLAFFFGGGGREGGVISQAAFLPASYLVPRPLTIQVNLTKKKDRREVTAAAVTNQKLFPRRLKTL